MTDATLPLIPPRHRPRIVVFVASADTVNANSLPRKADLYVTDTWSDVQPGIPAYDLTVLIVSHPALRDLAPHIAALQRSMPVTPIILVTDPHPESWRWLSGVTFAEILWMDELSTALWPAIRRALQNTGLNILHTRVVSAASFSVPLRLAIEHILVRRPPVQSIQQLVAEVGYARTTLWQCWDREVRNDSNFRLHDFMDWVLLCRAASLRTRGETRSGVAAALGIDPRTLTHRVLRLTGMSMSQFDTLDEGIVFEQFLEVLRSVPALKVLCDDQHANASGSLVVPDLPDYGDSCLASHVEVWPDS